MPNSMKTRNSCLRAFLHPSLSSQSHQYQTQNDHDDDDDDDYSFDHAHQHEYAHEHEHAYQAHHQHQRQAQHQNHQQHQQYNDDVIFAMKKSANESFHTGVTGRSDSTTGSRSPSTPLATMRTRGNHGNNGKGKGGGNIAIRRSKPKSKRNLKHLNAICNLIPSPSFAKGDDEWKSYSYKQDHRHNSSASNNNHKHRDLSSIFSSLDFDNVSFAHSQRSQVGLLGNNTDEQYYSPSQDNYDDSNDDNSNDDNDNANDWQYQSDDATEIYNDPPPQLAAAERHTHHSKRSTSTSLSSALKACVPNRKKMTHFKSSPKFSMPHIPEEAQPQLAQSNNLHPSQYDFPQIVFENDGSQENASESDRDGSQSRSQSKSISNVQPFSAHQRNCHAHDDPDPDPPIHPQMLQNHSSPMQTNANTEHRHEEEYLDTLANTLTLHDNYQHLQQHIYELTGKNELQRMTEHQQHYQNQPYPYSNTHVNAREAGVPFVVGHGTLDDESDLVSEFGMGSTSGGRYNHGPFMMQSLEGNAAQHYDRDYGPSRGAMATRRNIGKAKQTDGGWLRENMRGGQEPGAGSQGVHGRAANQWLHGDQQDAFDANVDVDGEGESYDPRLFGIDDRADAGKSKPANTLELQRMMDKPDSEGYIHARRQNLQQSSTHIRPVRSASPLSLRNKDESIDNMPSPKRVGLQSRPKKVDAFEKWKEERRATTLQNNNMQRQIAHGGSGGDSVVSSRRSNKYREVLGAPYKITTGNRRFSTESTQTRKWSNTTNITKNRLPNLMSTHDEE